MASCETGGFIYASALAVKIDIPLILIRKAGKLPPPVISVTKSQSHISSGLAQSVKEGKFEMGRDVARNGMKVVLVDDVLATGETLCAVLELLTKAGVKAEDVNVMVVVEFPIHRGRNLIYKRGFGRVRVQCLLVFGTA